jgi:2-aminoethylphosphonate-pyruvate transaminase
MSAVLPPARDKLLFTPGPLTTSASVKQAMLRDAGSWHFEFNALVARIRQRLLEVARLQDLTDWTAVLLQGSGTFGVEAVFQTSVPPDGKVLVLANGAYGERVAQILQTARIQHAVLRTAESVPAEPEALAARLAAEPAITHVAAVHCETTTGILNPIRAIGRVAKEHRKVYVVDAMSSFGGIPIDLAGCGVDFLVSSANKCIEGVPGFSFVLCRRSLLAACQGYARSLSLDLLAQLRGFEKNGQFRFTPPSHALLAFDQALNELEAEGGVAGRALRYVQNHEVLLRGLATLGFRPYLKPGVQSYIITAFPYPVEPQFSFDVFYRKLSDRGFIIYPGKLTQVDTFRIGTIGRLFPPDLEQLVHAVSRVLEEMGCAADAMERNSPREHI